MLLRHFIFATLIAFPLHSKAQHEISTNFGVGLFVSNYSSTWNTGVGYSLLNTKGPFATNTIVSFRFVSGVNFTHSQSKKKSHFNFLTIPIGGEVRCGKTGFVFARAKWNAKIALSHRGLSIDEVKPLVHAIQGEFGGGFSINSLLEFHIYTSLMHDISPQFLDHRSSPGGASYTQEFRTTQANLLNISMVFKLGGKN